MANTGLVWAEGSTRAAIQLLSFEWNFELQLVQLAVGRDGLTPGGFAVDHDFHGHVARVADAGPLHVPVGFLIVGEAADGFVRALSGR